MSLTNINVRGYHIDLYGHVNNARYLEFLEEARWELLDKTVDRDKWHRQGIGLSVVNININYRRPAVMGDRLEIKTTLERIGRKSVVLKQVITKTGDRRLVAEALVTFVIVDMKTLQAIPVSDEIRAELTAING